MCVKYVHALTHWGVMLCVCVGGGKLNSEQKCERDLERPNTRNNMVYTKQ
jgi:hypothetical protein